MTLPKQSLPENSRDSPCQTTLNEKQQVCGHGAHLLGSRPLQEHRGSGVWQCCQSHACGRGLSIPVEVDSHQPNLHGNLDSNKDLGHGQASQMVLEAQPSLDIS